jgi:hypothetical protein
MRMGNESKESTLESTVDVRRLRVIRAPIGAQILRSGLGGRELKAYKHR